MNYIIKVSSHKGKGREVESFMLIIYIYGVKSSKKLPNEILDVYVKKE